MSADEPATLTRWTQIEAIELCRRIEAVAPIFGCHVALTGGCLYKEGPRKDLDLVFYGIRQREIDFHGLLGALKGMGVATSGRVDAIEFVWCVRAVYEGKRIDLFFPEAETGDYDDALTWPDDLPSEVPS